MSSGMLLLAGLFATGPTSPPVLETAPMPRPKSARIAVELRLDVAPRSLTFGVGVGPARTLPSLPPATIPMPNPEPVAQPETWRVDAGRGLRIAVPPLGSHPQSCPPPEVHAMMLQALNQMSGAPPQCLPPAPVQAAWTSSSQSSRPGGMLPIGTWTRVVGPVKYKIEIKAETLVMTTTLTERGEDGSDGSVESIDHVLTADWYSTRNAGEVVGLVTGFDIVTSNKAMARDEVPGLLGSLADIQKQFSGKPIALTCRLSENDTLMIGDVRMPALKEEYSELSASFSSFGGNYKPLAAQSPAVVPARFGGMTLPGGKYLVHPPQYFPNDPTFPLPRELQDPTAPCQRVGIDFNDNPPRRFGIEAPAVRESIIPPFPPQVRNGFVANQTIWNWCFEPGSDRLTQAGRDRLDALAQDPSLTEAKLYLQVARDLAATNDNLDTLVKERNDLTAKRAARIKNYMNAQPVDGKALGYEVYVHDAVQPRPAVPPMPPPLPLPNPFRDGRFNR